MNDTNMKKDTVPAIDIPLSGAYLIEASAGTGKTWTLTGILLRLLLEKNTPPEKIVATTFTRAAAAEMKERLYERLEEFHGVCLWAERHKSMLFGQKIDRYDLIQAHSQEVLSLSDPINQHLLMGILNKSPKDLDGIIRRIQLLLSSMDKLFIGTLDSLAQKWLREFGQNDNLELVENHEQEVITIVHDTLRSLHHEVYYNSPKLYSMIDKNIFSDTESMVKISDNALKFFTSPIDEVDTINDKVLQKYENDLRILVENMVLEDFRGLLVDKEQLRSWGFKEKFYKSFCFLKDFIVDIKNSDNPLNFLYHLDDDKKKCLGLFTKHNINNAFNKKRNETIYQLWQGIDFDGLMKINKIYNKVSLINTHFREYIVYQVSNRLREQLPQILENKKQTSFTLRMVKLLNLLSGNEGEKIAQHIRYLYPIALIDEAQDINGEQARLLYNIYLKDGAKKSLFELSNKGFLLFVGDPKQAIYRFRGGDVANYNYIKSLGLNTDFVLSVNRRSNRHIIEALNHWFDGDQERKILGEDIFYTPITASKDMPAVSWLNDTKNKSIEFLHLKYKSPHEQLLAVALHVNTLLQSNKMIIDNDGTHRTIQPSDIAILVSTNDDIKIMQAHLKKLNINSIATTEQNVFDTKASLHLLQLMEAVLDTHDKKLVSMLTGIYGYSLKESHEILSNNNKRSELLIYLKKILNLWQKKGINYALSFAFSNPALIKVDFWSYLANYEHNERYLTDLWQLFDIVCTWDFAPMLFLREFYVQKNKSTHKRLPLPSESGISVMTIHRSKGLEFAIVYAVHLQKIVKSEDKIYTYTQDNQRRLSVTKYKDNEEYYKNIDVQESIDEKKRLAYVALTRAGEQLYVVVQDGEKMNDNVMKRWGFFQKSLFVMPDNLKEYANLISLDEIIDGKNFIDKSYQFVIEDKETKNHKPWADVYKKTKFFGIGNTSFTALTTHFEIQNDNSELSDDDIIMSSDNKSYGTIQSRFMRGARAGSYLHKVLQRISNNIGLKTAIINCAREMSIEFDDGMVSELESWMFQVISLPFLASGAHMGNIEGKYSEFGFLMRLKDDFNPSYIGQLFKAYSDKYLPEILFEQESIIKFLKGEIDLLYHYNGKYYIVDYKSNYLADECGLYNDTQMTNAMNEHGYWLQAVIYQVALHRLLKLRITNYIGNERNYLGAVEYVFLRGIDESNQYGRLVWDIPFVLIDELDKLFG